MWLNLRRSTSDRMPQSWLLCEAHMIYDNAEFVDWADWAPILMPNIVEANRKRQEEHLAGVAHQQLEAECTQAEINRKMAELNTKYEDGLIDRDQYATAFEEIANMHGEDVKMGNETKGVDLQPSEPARPN